jgi:hypothetical protein
VGKNYESLLPSSSAIYLFSIGYGGTTRALIPDVKGRLFLVGEAGMPHKISGNKPGEVTLLSGTPVPVSGVWRPNHDDCANLGELWLRKRAFFPHCPCCGQSANFTLVEEIAHISEDPDFQEEQ